MKKCKRYWDSNPRPLEHESPPINARPGLPTFWFEFFYGHEFVLVRCSCVKRKLLCKSSQTPKLVFARIRVSWKCLRRESLGTNAITIKWYYNRRFLKFLCQNCKFQLDLNSDFVNRRHAGSPLDHQHVPLHQNLHIIFH